MARPAVFEGKDRLHPGMSGYMTPEGHKAFDKARKRLGQLYTKITGKVIENISDGDVAEYLARGDADTRKYLEGRKGGR